MRPFFGLPFYFMVEIIYLSYSLCDASIPHSFVIFEYKQKCHLCGRTRIHRHHRFGLLSVKTQQ